MRKIGKKLAGAMALCLAVSAAPRSAYADLTEEQSGQISTAIVLAENDMTANEQAIRILLEQCLQALDESDPMAATIRSVIMLLDSGAADAQSVSVLLRSLLDGMDAGQSQAPEGAAGETSAQAPEESSGVADAGQTDPGQEAPPADAAATSQPQGNAQGDGGQGNAMNAQSQVQPETMSPEQEAALANDPTRDVRNNVAGLPAYEVSSFVQTDLQQTVTLDVPEDWGNNASGRALTSYSPVNDSGAISPAAGTLTVSYFPMEGTDEGAALDSYAKNIAEMSVVTSFASEIVQAAQLRGRYLYFTMTVGANRFTCETFCFAYNGDIYAIELMQGQQTSYDYFPVYTQVVDSTQADNVQVINTGGTLPEETAQGADDGGQVIEDQIGADDGGQVIDDQIGADDGGQVVDDQIGADDGGQIVEEQIGADDSGQVVDDQIGADDGGQIVEEQIGGADDGSQGAGQEGEIIEELPGGPEPGASNVDENAILADINETGDMGVFLYEINGHVYMYPTAVMDLEAGDLPLNMTQELPYQFNSDADMEEGTWNELVNTQIFYFESPLYKELAGVTNLAGYPIPMSEGVVTALVDTQGEFVNVTLPGGVKVGSYESDILKGFPRFAQTELDGMAHFDGNELLYARNVRDDGCNGYALIKNDPPYYSALTIICKEGVIQEISFECLGPDRAQGVFLEEEGT